jgi:hypothetical protein
VLLLWELRDDPLVTLWLREGTQFVTLTEDAQESIAVLEMTIGELHLPCVISAIADLSEPRLCFADKFWAKVSA